MNEKLIFEIGDLIRVKYKGSFNPKKWFKPDKLTAKEVMDSVEFKSFIRNFPELKRLAEKSYE